MKIPLFDIDGTLFRTADPVHYNAFSYAFKNVYGIDAKQDDPGTPEGRTDSQIIVEVISYHGIKQEIARKKLKTALQVMAEYFDEHRNEVKPIVINGVKELLMELKKHKSPIGVLTGNVEGIGWTKIERAGIRDYFDFGAFGDKTEIRSELVEIARQSAQIALKKGIELKDLIIVGDTPRDIKCAKDSGIKVIAVATGRPTLEELKQHQPDLLVPNFEGDEGKKVIEFLNN